MPFPRLTTLKSANRPRRGGGISYGDVIQFKTKDGTRTEGIVISTAPAYDENNIGWLHVNDENDTAHWAQFSHCTRVDPPYQPEDDSPRRPFDERYGY